MLIGQVSVRYPCWLLSGTPHFLSWLLSARGQGWHGWHPLIVAWLLAWCSANMILPKTWCSADGYITFSAKLVCFLPFFPPFFDELEHTWHLAAFAFPGKMWGKWHSVRQTGVSWAAVQTGTELWRSWQLVSSSYLVISVKNFKVCSSCLLPDDERCECLT